MAKSINRGLGALAALGALSYHLSKGRGRTDGGAPVDDRNVDTTRGYDTAGAEGFMSGAADQGDTGDFLSRRLRVNPETGQAYSMDNLSPMGGGGGGARSVARPAGMSAAAMDAGYANRAASPVGAGAGRGGQGGPTAAELDAYAQLNRGAGAGRGGQGGPTAAELDAYARLNRGAGAGRGGQGGPTAAELDAYARQRASARPAPRQMTREEMIGQIPTDGYSDVSGGDRVSGNEFTRNIGNIVTGLGPSKLAGFGKVGAEMATARGAAQRAAALRAERAEAARRGQTPTSFTSTRPSDSAKRIRKFDEEEVGVEFKRGGKTKTKPKPKKMASGGMTSASKRADGIASKGKTKCKMY